LPPQVPKHDFDRPPQGAVDDLSTQAGPTGDSRLMRGAFLEREVLLRAFGLVKIASGIVWLVLAGLVFARDVHLRDLIFTDLRLPWYLLARPYQVALLLVVVAGGHLLIAWGLWKLQDLARIMQGLLSGILEFFLLAILAVQMIFWLFGTPSLPLLAGALLAGIVHLVYLALLLDRASYQVCTPDYAQIREETPDTAWRPLLLQRVLVLAMAWILGSLGGLLILVTWL